MENREASNQVIKVGDVALPCPDKSFNDFIVGLLGKPQEIEGGQFGSFSVGPNEIIQTYHLIHQRVMQQNGVSPVGFALRIVYDDGTSIQLNSFDDLQHFNEPKPVISTECHLSLSYLIKFPLSPAPERQDISISFISSTPSRGSRLPLATFAPTIRELFARGYINYRIKYTARTWGADIEGLLRNHIEHVIDEEPRIRVFMRNFSVPIGLITGAITFAIVFYGQSIVSERVVIDQLATLGTMFGKGASVDSKLDAIIQMLVSGTATRISELSSRFLSIGAIASIVLAFYVEDKADTRKPSFIVFTKKAEEAKTASLGRYGKNWLRLWTSIIGGLAIGVGANFIYDHFAKSAMNEIMSSVVHQSSQKDGAEHK